MHSKNNAENRTQPTEKPKPEKMKAKAALKISSIIKNTTIEPVMFLHAVSMTMIYIIAQSLKVYKVCRGTFGHSIEVCQNLRENKTLEEESQRVASDLGMYWAIIQTVPSTILTIFLGTWSDTYGRKIPMIVPLAGASLSGIVLIAAAQFEELPAEFLLLSPALAGLSGGFMTLIVAVFSYISDVSTEESRTVRMGFVTGLWFLGAPVGSILAGILITYTNYTLIFSLGTVVMVTCLVYVHFRVKDNIQKPESTSKKTMWKELCSCHTCKDSFVTALKKRPDHKRAHLWFLIFCMCALFLPIIGEGNVRYLYTRYKFEWKDSMYSYYLATAMGVGALVTIFILPIMTKNLKMHDINIAIVAIVARIISELIVAFSSSGLIMFLSPITLVGECAGPPMRSLMSKCVQPNEVGKMFTMLAVVEAGLPVVSGVMYSQVYNATIEIHCCGIVFLVTVGMYLMVLVVLFWLRYDTNKLALRHVNNPEIPEEPIKQLNKNGNSKLDEVDAQFREIKEKEPANLGYTNESFEPLQDDAVDIQTKTSHM